MAWPFEPLPMFGFDVIMADPPWLFQLYGESGNQKSPQGQYACMRTADICALPVSQLARGDCWLWLWATYPMLGDGLRVLDAWGFRYVTGGPWVKRGASGKLAFGPGYVLRGNAEAFLIGRVGNPATFSRSIRNVIEAPRGRHSEKPDEAYAMAEKLFGPATRADLFSRRTRPGWSAWGHGAGTLDNPNAVVQRRAPVLRQGRVVDADQASLFGAAA